MSIANELDTARITFEALFNTALDRTKLGGLEKVIAQEAKGDGLAHTFTMAGAMPAFKAWEGAAEAGGFREYSVTVPFAKQKAMVKLKREQVEQDKTGAIGQKLAAFTSDLPYLYEKLVMAKLVANPTGIDGVALLSASHPYAEGGGTWDNLSSDALSFAAYDTARSDGENFEDEYGEPLDLNYDTIIVPPNLRRTALEIARAEDRPISVGTAGAINSGGIGATGITNVYKGDLTVIVTPRMTASKWILMDSRYKPIGLVKWGAPRAVISDGLESTHRQYYDEFLYGIEADVAAVGLQPWGIYGNL